MPEPVALSRTGHTSVLGKLDATLEKMRISSDTLEGLRRRAHDADIPLTEYVRLVLDTHVHGVDHVANLAAARVRAVVGMGG